MPLADDLEKQAGALLTQRKIPEFVTHEQVQCVIIMELFQQRVVRLCGNQLIDHVNGRGKEHLDIGVSRCIGEAFGQEGFAGTGIADENDITMGGDESQG
jgi:hypothetical protein